MANIFSILLSGLIFFQSFNVGVTNYTKLITMIQHLDYHQENFDDNLADFVSIHYGSEQILHSEDHEHKNEHENLPFKKESKTSQNAPIDFIINNSSIIINNNSFSEISINFLYREMHSTYKKPNVFQPPKHS